MVLCLARIFLTASLASSVSTAYAHRLSQCLERRDLLKSSLPVIVTASAAGSASDSQTIRQPTDTPTSSVVTATHVILTTTTVFTTIASNARTTTFSPTNALQVLSAAERSFSLQDITSDLPPIVTDAPIGTSGPHTSINPSATPVSGTSHPLLSSQINKKPATNAMSGLPSILIEPTMTELNQATSATINSSSSLFTNHNEPSTIHNSLAASDSAGSILAAMSAFNARSMSSDLVVPSTLAAQNRVAPVFSTAKTDGALQAAATVSRASSISIQRASWLRTAVAAIVALPFILR